MAEHLAKREDLWGQRNSGASCATGGGAPGENIGFASETAAATGISKSTVTRALSRAKAIPEDVRDLIKGTKLDTGTYLDWLKGIGHPGRGRKSPRHIRFVHLREHRRPSRSVGDP
jgi:hypothetical protein